MLDHPKSKVGIIACSGEEIPEGTITRLAALKVLESLRPHETVTICLPLFLAGGEGDRTFARLHPTIAVDGCEKRCAARGTEMYSAKPAVSIVVTDGAPAESSGLGSARRLNERGKHLVSDVADQIAQRVDELLDLKRDRCRRRGPQVDGPESREETKPRQAACSCGSGIPTQTLKIAGREVALMALPLLFAQFRRAGRVPDDATKIELMRAVKVYNSISDADEAFYEQAIMQEYGAFCTRSH